ncbi:hypothetical protein [Actinacidiphila sp. bgisy160]|uniref:hypothetical protein n=1 Tax=Actinacidiphila sp. bgisy160 TaxID=3413796 RepID=UPI003D7108F1
MTWNVTWAPIPGFALPALARPWPASRASPARSATPGRGLRPRTALLILGTCYDAMAVAGDVVQVLFGAPG